MYRVCATVALMKATNATREAIAAEVRAGLARKRMTQAELADALNMGLPTLSRRLNGHQPFNTDQLIAISRVLGIAFAMFFEGEGDAA